MKRRADSARDKSIIEGRLQAKPLQVFFFCAKLVIVLLGGAIVLI